VLENLQLDPLLRSASSIKPIFRLSYLAARGDFDQTHRLRQLFI
jgi:hypothetical protein